MFLFKEREVLQVFYVWEIRMKIQNASYHKKDLRNNSHQYFHNVFGFLSLPFVTFLSLIWVQRTKIYRTLLIDFR
jgi:hypothetical protein